MLYFLLAFKVQLAIWTVLVASTNSDNVPTKGQLADFGIVSSFIDKFIKPYFLTIRANLQPRSRDETVIEKAIRLKIKNLKPQLQDDDQDGNGNKENEDNLALEGTDETTIIEFMPKAPGDTRKQKGKDVKPDTFKQTINRYKELRRAIVIKLNKENTAPKTKRLIVRTLDEMLAQLVEKQCTWKGASAVNLPDHVFRAQNETHNSISKLHNLTNDEWKNLRKQYLRFLEHKGGQEDSFMRQFHTFFAKSNSDMGNLSQRYKVRCQLVRAYDEPKHELRSKEKDPCKPFKICSDELKEFLTNLYTYLNDTSVSIFQNYAAMYIRDVNADVDQDKDAVVNVLNKLSKAAERKVRKIYKKDLNTLTLDTNKQKLKNIENINGFITTSVAHIRKVLQKIIDKELDTQQTKLFLTVKDDLTVNLKVDMENLVGLFIDRICKFFVLCNGRYDARRSRHSNGSDDEGQQIYVKVQVSLDDELREAIGRSANVYQYLNVQNLRQIARGGVEMAKEGVNIAKNFAMNRFARNNQIDLSKYNSVNITRTQHTTTPKGLIVTLFVKDEFNNTAVTEKTSKKGKVDLDINNTI